MPNHSPSTLPAKVPRFLPKLLAQSNSTQSTAIIKVCKLISQLTTTINNLSGTFNSTSKMQHQTPKFFLGIALHHVAAAKPSPATPICWYQTRKCLPEAELSGVSHQCLVFYGTYVSTKRRFLIDIGAKVSLHQLNNCLMDVMSREQQIQMNCMVLRERNSFLHIFQKASNKYFTGRGLIYYHPTKSVLQTVRLFNACSSSNCKPTLWLVRATFIRSTK